MSQDDLIALVSFAATLPSQTWRLASCHTACLPGGQPARLAPFVRHEKSNIHWLPQHSRPPAVATEQGGNMTGMSSNHPHSVRKLPRCS